MGSTLVSLNRKLRGRRLITGLVAATLFAVACELTDPSESVIVIEMTTDSTLVVGSPFVARFTVTVDGLPITDPRLLLQSSDASVIQVSGDTLQPLRRGTADLTIVLLSSTIGDELPTVTLTLRAIAASVDIAEASILLESLGDTVKLTPVALSSEDDTLTVEGAQWLTDDATVATVSADGWVEAVKNGSITVRLVVDDDTASVPVEVKQRLVRYGLAPSPLTIASLGATSSVTATPLDAGGSVIPAGAAAAPTWASRDETIATVTNAGAVTSIENGETYIVATATDVADSVELVVRQLATTIDILPSRTVLGAIEDTVRLSAVATDALGEFVLNRLPSWVSRNPLVAQVDPTSGVVRALDEGSVVIVARMDQAADSVTLTIADSAAVVALPADTFRFSSLNDTTLVSVSVRNKLGALLADQSVSWTTGDPTIAEVLSDGRLIANGIGTTVLVANATDPAKVEAVDTAAVVVQNLPETVSIVPVDTVLTSVGDQYSPTVDIRNTRGDPLDRSAAAWSTKDSTVATVNSSGLIVGRGRGTTFILAVNPLNAARRDSVEITVSNAPATVDLSPDNVILTAPGRTQQYQVLVRNARGDVISGEPVRYISRNEAFVTIDDIGFATGAAEGSTWIVAEAGGGGELFPLVRDSVAITVENNVVQVTLNPTSWIIPSIGDEKVLEARALNDFGNTVENVPFVWSSNNTGVAEVSPLGIVTATGIGTAIITVEFSGLSATSEIEVRNSPVVIDIAEDTLDFASVQDVQFPNVTLLNSLNASLPNSAALWTSDRPDIAEVDDVGNITALKRGKTVVRASSPLNASVTDSVIVRVLNTPIDIIVEPAGTSTITAIGDDERYFARVLNNNNAVMTDISVIWTTGSDAVAQIQSTSSTEAVATATGPGTTQVTATVDESDLLEPLTSPLTDVATLVVSNNATTLVIDPNPVNLSSSGFSTQLTLDVRNALGDPIPDPDIEWSVNNVSIATVVEDPGDARLATVTAQAAGITDVVAKALDDNGVVVKTTSAQVIVTDYPSTISIEPPAAATLASVGNILQLVQYVEGSPQANQVEIRNANGDLLALNNPGVVWSTSGNGVVDVTQGGRITATAAGVDTVTVASVQNPTVVAEFEVTVTNATVSLTIERKSDGADITGTSFALAPVDAAIDVKATPRNAAGNETTTPVTWASSVPGVVSITPVAGTTEAEILASGVGTTTVTATAQDNSTQADITITVTNPATEITLTPAADTIPEPSGTVQLTATAKNSLGAVLPDDEVLFELVDPNDTTIATVSNDPATVGLVTATDIRSRLLSPRTVIVRARDVGNNVSKTSTIIVVVAPATILFTELNSATELTSLDFTSIGAKAKPDSAGYSIVLEDTQGNQLAPSTAEWTVSQAGTISVDNATGRITALAEGTVTLTATSIYDPNITDDVQVTVTDVPTEVTVTPGTFTITAIDATKDFNATVKNAVGGEVTGGTLTWTVGPNADPASAWTAGDSILAIDENTGLVTALKVGTDAYVRATVNKDGTIVTGTAVVAVENVPASLTISPETVTITSVGGSAEIFAVVLNSEGTRIEDPDVTWELVGTGPVTITGSPNDTVTITADTIGTAIVKATAGAASNQRSVTVTNEIAAIAVTITPPATLDGIGTTVPKEDLVDVTNAEGRLIPAADAQWTVTPANIVDVTGDDITALAVGNATVTAKSPNNAAISASFAIEVTNAVAEVVLSDTGDTFRAIPQALQYAARANNAQGVEIPGATITWTRTDCAAPPTGVTPDSLAISFSSTNGKVVTITADGEGCATVTATSGAFTDEADIVVLPSKRLYVNQVVGAANDTSASLDLEHGTKKYPFKSIENALVPAVSSDTIVVQKTPADYVQAVTVFVPNLIIRGDTESCAPNCNSSNLPRLKHSAPAQAPVITSNVSVTFEDLLIVANASYAALQVDNPGGDVEVNRVVISDPNNASSASGLRITGLTGTENIAIDSLVVRDLGTAVDLNGTANAVAITNSRLYRNSVGIKLPAYTSISVIGNDLWDNTIAGLTGSEAAGAPFDNWWGDNLGPRPAGATDVDATSVGDSIAFAAAFNSAIAGLFDEMPNTSASTALVASVTPLLKLNNTVGNAVIVDVLPGNKGEATFAVRTVDANGLPVENVTVTPTIATITPAANDVVACVPADCGSGSDGLVRIEVTLAAKSGNDFVTDQTRDVTVSAGGATAAVVTVRFPEPGTPAQYVISTPDSTPEVDVQFTVTAQLADALGDPVDEANRTVTWSATGGALGGTNPSTTDANGRTTILFTPGQTAGVDFTLTATDTESLTGELTVTSAPGPAAAAQSVISAAPTTIAADGVATSLITVQLRDQYSNDLEVSDGDVVLSLDPATPWTLEAAAQDQNNGTWTATLAASQDAGTVTVNGTLDTGGGTQNIGTSASVTFEQQQADATNSTVVASPTTIEASNGSAQSTVTVTAKDANDRAIKDASVTLTSDGENNTISATATTDGNGEATFTFSSTKAQTKNLSAEITAGGVPVDLTDAETVTVTPAATAFFVIINPTDGTVDDPITVTVEATDAFANLVESEDRDVDLVAGGAATGDGTVDIQNGVGTIDISNETAETVNLSLDNGPAGVDITSTEAVVFDPGAATKYLVTVSDENVSAGSDIQVSAQLADQFGNAVATENLTVTWAQDPAAAGNFSSPTTDTNASGVAVVTFTTSSTAGIDHTITATDNSNPTPLTGTSPTITTQ